MSETTPIAKAITYFGQPAIVVCDAKCSKAWGATSRPKVSLSDDPDDYALLADDELGEAPADPGTYEGGHAKPQAPDQRLNKWCVRQCERSGLSRPGQSTELLAAPDHSKRINNLPNRSEPSP